MLPAQLTLSPFDDASTAQKGIAQFNSTNFSAAAGVINTIQNIATTSNPTFNSLILNGSTTLGDASSDLITFNGTIQGRQPIGV